MCGGEFKWSLSVGIREGVWRFGFGMDFLNEG